MIDDLLSIDLGGDLKNMDIDLVLNAIKRDKKVRNGKINFVLLEEIASPVIVSDVKDDMIKSGLIWLKDRKA
jgi:3-dehydroquinate synthetase